MQVIDDQNFITRLQDIGERDKKEKVRKDPIFFRKGRVGFIQ